MRTWMVVLWLAVAACGGDEGLPGYVQTMPAILDDSIYVALSNGTSTRIVTTTLDGDVQEVRWGGAPVEFDSDLVATTDAILWLGPGPGGKSVYRLPRDARSPGTLRPVLAGKARGSLGLLGPDIYALSSGAISKVTDVEAEILVDQAVAFAIEGGALYYVTQTELYRYIPGSQPQLIANVGGGEQLVVHAGSAYIRYQGFIRRVDLATGVVDDSLLSITGDAVLVHNDNTLFVVLNGRLLNVDDHFAELAAEIYRPEVFATNSRIYHVDFLDEGRDVIRWIDL